MDRWNFNIDACFNVFMTVAYDANGAWEIRPPKGKRGDYMTLRALMPQIVAISNCPILFNACNNFSFEAVEARDFGLGPNSHCSEAKVTVAIDGAKRSFSGIAVSPAGR
jgi:uncharacterized protein YcgI (DUF1989 family)